MSDFVPDCICWCLVKEHVLTIYRVTSDSVLAGHNGSKCWAAKGCYHCSYNSIKVFGGYYWFNWFWHGNSYHLANELARGGAYQEANLLQFFTFPVASVHLFPLRSLHVTLFLA